MLKTHENKEVFCAFPFNRIKIDPEGDATMCCFHERKCLGNVLDAGLEAVWNSAIANEIRESTLRNELHSTCCDSICPFIHVKNDLVNRRIHKVRVPLNPPMPFPRNIELDLPTQWCNIGGLKPTSKNPACIMCERHVNFVPQKDRIKEICLMLRKYTFDTVHIQGVAEPFWKDRIFEMLDDMNLWDKPDTTVTTTTNGTILTKERIHRFLQLPKCGITFSIDASTPKTYKRIRRLDAYYSVIKALKLYNSMRNPETQNLYIHNNINLINVDEVIGMVATASEVNVNHLEFNPTYATPGICVTKSNVHLFKKAEMQILETAKELGVTVNFLRKMTLDIEDETLIQLG
jgi:MoaA/NifB/PqqE/SkfB family radical SAM enzyme